MCGRRLSSLSLSASLHWTASRSILHRADGRNACCELDWTAQRVDWCYYERQLMKIHLLTESRRRRGFIVDLSPKQFRCILRDMPTDWPSDVLSEDVDWSLELSLVSVSYQ